MMRAALLLGRLSTRTNNGGAWISMKAATTTKAASVEQVVPLLDSVCLSVDGTLPPTARDAARRVCDIYRHLPAGSRLQVAKHLATAHAVRHETLSSACETYLSNQEPVHRSQLAERLVSAARPRAMEFVHAVGSLDKGVKFLVDFRADVRRMIHAGEPVDGATAAALRSLDHWLRDAIALWFSVGLLHLERVTWRSSCDMMEKIRDGEAVHPVRNLADMKRRVGLGRRCFVFTHPAMPRQPLVVLHVALLDRIEHNIQNVLDEYDKLVDNPRTAVASNEDIRELERPILRRATTALFYSISKMQPGLAGIDLGNELIKRVVSELRMELPRLERFATLSPVPGFAAWLRTKLLAVEQDVTEPIVSDVMAGYVCSWLPDAAAAGARDSAAVRAALAAVLADPGWMDKPNLHTHMEPVLLHWTARYLCMEKHRGKAVCPVANFHLRNGAELWRINYMGDTSKAGRDRSHGVMVHYRYFLDKLLGNADGYAAGGEIWHSYKVKELLDFDKCLKRYAIHHPAQPALKHKL